ncbi:MAG TPA: hypothetical protein VNK52_14070, partial [Hyphomicrobiaceae bacterium]|nr:hypothetical protein [Hyphomicrobiaceae bacterium]
MIGAWLAIAVLVLAAAPFDQGSGQALAAVDGKTDRSLVIATVQIEADGTGAFEGSGPPDARISLMLRGDDVGEAIVDSRGAWRLMLARPLAAGEHHLWLVVHRAGAGETCTGAMVRIAIPGHVATVPAELSPAAQHRDLLRRASALANTASRAFDELLPQLTGTAPLFPAPTVEQNSLAQIERAWGQSLLEWWAALLAAAQEWLAASA